MFKIFKKHSKTLWISMQDVLAIIKVTMTNPGHLRL